MCSGNGSGWGRHGSGVDWSKYINPAIINTFCASRCSVMCIYILRLSWS